MIYDFLLKFKLASAATDIDAIIEALGEAGCDDATVGIGTAGFVALDFSRDSRSAEEAVLSAIEAVKRAIPDAELAEAAPDYVGLTDVAELVGVTRQNLRKLRQSNADFPTPLHSGSTQLWHLLEVLEWFVGRSMYKVEAKLVDVAAVAMQCNVAKEAAKLVQVQKAPHSYAKRLRAAVA